MIRVVHPGSRIPDPDADFLPSRIPDSGSRGQKGTQSRIPDPDPQHCYLVFVLFPAAVLILLVLLWNQLYRSKQEKKHRHDSLT